jgi:hypothetical protein
MDFIPGGKVFIPKGMYFSSGGKSFIPIGTFEF